MCRFPLLLFPFLVFPKQFIRGLLLEIFFKNFNLLLCLFLHFGLLSNRDLIFASTYLTFHQNHTFILLNQASIAQRNFIFYLIQLYNL